MLPTYFYNKRASLCLRKRGFFNSFKAPEYLLQRYNLNQSCYLKGIQNELHILLSALSLLHQPTVCIASRAYLLKSSIRLKLTIGLVGIYIYNGKILFLFIKRLSCCFKLLQSKHKIKFKKKAGVKIRKKILQFTCALLIEKGSKSWHLKENRCQQNRHVVTSSDTKVNFLKEFHNDKSIYR